MTLDSGKKCEIEPWQRKVVKDVLDGTLTTWLITPEQNGKTSLASMLVSTTWTPEGWGIEQPKIVVAASTVKQASWLYTQAARLVLMNPSSCAVG